MRISVRRSREARADLSDRVSVSRNTFFSRVFGDWRAARGWFLVVTFAGILLGHHSILARGVGMRPAGKGEELAASSDPTPENVLAGLEVQEKSLRELRRYARRGLDLGHGRREHRDDRFGAGRRRGAPHEAG